MQAYVNQKTIHAETSKWLARIAPFNTHVMQINREKAALLIVDIAPLSGEKVILKHRYSAFYNTDLETVLRCLKVEDLVISGIMTNMCCESTARDAYYRDYRVFFPADGTGSITEEMHLASLLNLAFGFAWVTDLATLITQLREAGTP